MRENMQVVISAADETKAAFLSAKQGMERLSGDIQSTENAIMGMNAAWLKAGAVVATAAMAIKQAWDLAAPAARFEEQTIALNNLAQQYGTSAGAMLTAIQKVASGTIAQVDAISIANKGLLMGLNPQQLEFFTNAAERLSGAIGGDTAQAFETLTQAVATGQQRLLRQLGIIVDLEAEYEKYGRELSLAEKQAINFETVSQALNMTFAQMGANIDTAADKMERLSAKMKDAKISAGQLILEATAAVYGALYPAQLESAFAQAVSDSENLYKNLDELRKKAKELAAEGLTIGGENQILADRTALIMEAIRQSEAFEMQMIRENETRKLIMQTAIEQFKEEQKIMQERYAAYVATAARQEEFQQRKSPYEEFTTGIVAESSPAAAEVFKYQQSIEALQQFQQQEMDLILAHNTAKIQLALARGASENEIAAINAENMMNYKDTEVNHSLKMDEMKWQAGIAMMGSSLARTGAMMMQGSKSQFEIGKKLALAGAVVSGAQAITNAFATPPFFPLGLALGALAIMQTALQIQTIKNMQFGGAMATTPAGTIGASGVSAFQTAMPQPLSSQEQTQQTQNIAVNVYTLDPSSVMWDKIIEDNIKPAMEKASNRNIVFDIKTTQQ